MSNKGYKVILTSIGRLLGIVTIWLWSLRSAARIIGGFALITSAAWYLSVPLGLAIAGVSLWAIDYLAGSGRSGSTGAKRTP